MFTGLIREFATVKSFLNNLLVLKAKYKPNIGDSIAVNGACLSVVDVKDGEFTVELSHESKKVLALQNYKGKVHIEPAMKLSDRLEGHIVQGHVDCVGTIVKIEKKESGSDFYISIDKEFLKFVIPKGSIAVDGVSLTVNEVINDHVRLTIIPLTLKHTLFNSYIIGTKVNIETDMFARYIYYIFNKSNPTNWEQIDRIMALY